MVKGCFLRISGLKVWELHDDKNIRSFFIQIAASLWEKGV